MNKNLEKNTSSKNIEKFRELVKEIQLSMFSTVCEEDGSICSRPMTLQEVDESQSMWFFVGKDSNLVSDIAANPNVNISFSHPGKSSYVSVVAQAELVDDKEKIKELFSPTVKAWFPDGPEDKNLALLKCQVEVADYWDSPSSTAVQLYAFAKSVLTGKRPGEELGVHKSVSFKQ